MDERSARELRHDKLLQGSVFFRAADRDQQQALLDDIVEEFLRQRLDELLTEGLALLDSRQRIAAGSDATEEGWSW